MGIAIQCILEQPVIGPPEMDGKLLCAAFCSDPGYHLDEGDQDFAPATNLVAIDFGRTAPPSQDRAMGDSLFGPLGQFITGDHGIEWHDPSQGLSVIRGILSKLKSGARVVLDPDLDFFGDGEDEITEAVIDDLEALEQILMAAERLQVRFRLFVEA